MTHRTQRKPSVCFLEAVLLGQLAKDWFSRHRRRLGWFGADDERVSLGKLHRWTVIYHDISYVYLMYILCISYVYLMYILCISYVYLMYILCISYVYLMYILCIRLSKLFKYWISTYRWLLLVNLWRRRVHQKKTWGIGASWKTEFQHKWWDFVSKIGWFGIWKNNELCIFWYPTGPVPLIAGPIYSELSGSRNHHSNTIRIPWLFPRPGPPMVRLEELSQTLGFSKEKDFHLQSIPQLGEICKWWILLFPWLKSMISVELLGMTWTHPK